MTIERSFGATGVVTGSCHLLRFEDGTQALVDCGMFQGLEEDKNYEPLEFNPKEIDYLLITHAHLDHVGRIPLLVKHGFKGKIVATAATFEMMKIVLLDTVHLMQEDFATSYKKALRRGVEDEVKRPLYDKNDVKKVFKLKRVIAQYGKSIKLSPNIHVTYKDAAHIIGSAFIEIAYKENGIEKRVIFSGDLGNRQVPLNTPPQSAKASDFLFVESTYGDRVHRSYEESVEELKNAVISTLKRDGVVLIPSFAIERTQQLLCIFSEMSKNREFPKGTKVFLDSPMAIKTTKIYEKYKYLLSDYCKNKKYPFEFDELHFTSTPNASKRINSIKSKAIIIAGSGMCNGGRILHHLKHRIWNPKNSLIIVGYQAEGTLGREIVEGAKRIEIYAEPIVVKAKLYTINGFSAHADRYELLEWIEEIKGLKKIFLIHGEEEIQRKFKKFLLEKTHKKIHIVKESEIIHI